MTGPYPSPILDGLRLVLEEQSKCECGAAERRTDDRAIVDHDDACPARKIGDRINDAILPIQEPRW